MPRLAEQGKVNYFWSNFVCILIILPLLVIQNWVTFVTYPF